MDWMDAAPIIMTFIAAIGYRVIGKPKRENDKETLSRTLAIIDDRLELHTDLVGIKEELQAIRKILEGKTDG